jgi:hypothetical protein
MKKSSNDADSKEQIKVCPNEFKRIIENLKEVNLLKEDLDNESPFKDLPITCNYCSTIPVDTIECHKCDKLFCKSCFVNNVAGKLFKECPEHENREMQNNKVNKLL